MVDLNKNILDAAKDATEGRMKTYGHPKNHFKLVALLWGSYLGRPVSKECVGRMMILFKIARDAFQSNNENLTDIAGYARTLQMLKEETEDAY